MVREIQKDELKFNWLISCNWIWRKKKFIFVSLNININMVLSSLLTEEFAANVKKFSRRQFYCEKV